MGRWIATLLLGGSAFAQAGEPLPEPLAGFVRAHCIECHGAQKQRARLDFEALRVDWEGPQTRETFTRMRDVLAAGDMPPEEAQSKPTEAERAELVAWLDAQLSMNSVVGGTVVRRLNRVEYANTIRDLFEIDFELPASFPLDSTAHGFDTNGEALVISPPQLRQYLEVAGAVADELISLAVPVRMDRVFSGAEFGGPLSGELPDRQRLVNAIDELTWTSRPEGFEAPFDGSYRLTVRAASFGNLNGAPMRLEVRAVPTGTDPLEPFTSQRLVRSLELEPGGARDLSFEADLFAGEGLAFQFASSPLRKSGAGLVHPYAIQYVRREHREFLDALIAVGYDPQASDEKNYTRVVQAMGTTHGVPREAQRTEYAKRLHQPGMVRGFFLPIWQRVHAKGAAIDVFDVRVEGPVGPLVELSRWLPPQGERDDATFAEDMLRPLLRRALRRPVEDAEVERYVHLALDHAAQQGSIRHGLHFAVRVLLCSPDFLYRETREGPLDDHELATRLSYFMWSTTPTPGLLDLADQGALSDDRQLAALVRRMVLSPRTRQLASHFTGQWLLTRKIHGLMPDERLFPQWRPRMYAMLTEETERFFMTVLRGNLDVDHFLDSSFTFANSDLAALYGLPPVEGRELRRVSLDGTRHRGGVLGQAAVLMATANGVDTSPVIRGVWLLENIVGDGVGPPPDDVPALAPDSSGAVSMRERIAQHRADPLCARCHDRIDPLGFALESYDAIGGWREHYPRVVAGPDGESVVEAGLAIDTGGELPDGTRIDDIDDLRAYLLANRHDFYRCLAEKLMVYGTGRALNAADEEVVERITQDALTRGQGFEDLLVAIVLSESFRTK